MDALSLNMFQRLVRSWEAVHPYNAVQALKLSGQPDFAAINGAWHRSLAAVGLGRVRANCTSFGYEILNGEADRYPVRSLPPGTSLESHLSNALNEPFDNDDEPPLRPFLIPLDDAFYLGLTYRHWIADSASIRLLIREWCRPVTRSQPRRAESAANGEDRYWDSTAPAADNFASIRQFSACFARTCVSHGAKGSHARHGRLSHALLIRELPFGAVNALRLAARRRGVTVGDALQAALAIACHRHVPLQRRSERRHRHRQYRRSAKTRRSRFIQHVWFLPRLHARRLPAAGHE